jgi:electron transport complex protein RnfD
MKFIVSPGPYIRNPLAKTKQAMLEYTIGLLGLFLFSVGFHWLTHGLAYGVKAIGMMVTSLIVTFLADLFVGALKYQPSHGRLRPYLFGFVKKNYSYVTAVLMTLTLPIGTPYYVVILGSLFATLIVKYTFGGFGANIFNPAAFGRIFVGVAFASQLNAYIGSPADVPSLTATGQTITTVFNATYPGWIGTSLTNFPVDSLWRLYLGNYSGALGETSVLLIVILGSILTILKAHNWRPTVFFLVTIWLSAFGIALVSGLNPIIYAFTFVGIGSVFFGGMFMLTDPVTSPTTNFGKALIGIIAGLVVVLIRTQTGLPEGVVYGIAVANLASPIIDKYTTGLTNQFLKQRYALLLALMLTSVSISSCNALTAIPGSSTSQSSSEIVVTPFKVFTGQATSYAYDEAEEETTIFIEVGVDRDFKIVDITILSGASSLGGYLTNWNNQKGPVLDYYKTLTIKEVKALTIATLPSQLTLTGLTVTTDRLFEAVQQSVAHLDVYQGSASSFSCDDEYCDELKTIEATVYVDRETSVIEGLVLEGYVASTGSYLTRYQSNKEVIQDYYIGQTVASILALNQPPLYPDFNGTQTGLTVTLERIFDAIIDALQSEAL